MTYSTDPDSGVSMVSNCSERRYFGTDRSPPTQTSPRFEVDMVRTLIPCAQRALSLVVVSVSIAAAQSNPRTTPATQRAAPAVAKMPMMASVDSALLRGLNYRLVGHSRGGRVTTVTGVPSQPRTFYMGVASGGLFRTTDGGASWVPITDGKVPLGSTGSIAVADSDPRIIYLGTGSDGVRSNVSTGTGVYKTTDGGKTWKKTLFVSDTVGAMDVELQPGNPNVVYAWMSRLERKPWTIISGGREGGFYKSTDGGERFTKITTGLPGDLIGKG